MPFAWHEIRDHLMHSSSTLNFQRRFDAIRREKDALAPFRDPAALLDGLHRSSGDSDGKNLILSALVEAAQSNGPSSDSALTMLLLALWPGLDAIRRRSIWRKLGSADEIASDVLARTTEVVRGLDLRRVSRIAATVLMNVERDMLRARRRDVERESLTSNIELDDVPEDRTVQLSAVEDAHLRGDLHKLVGADAVLVMRVAIEGYSQTEAAIELGLTEAATRKRYQRTMRKLRDALQETP